MATSLDDETQQPSFHQSSLPAVSSPFRPADPSARLVPSSSPAAEESAGGFMAQQITKSSYEEQDDNTESLRESLVEKRVKKVQTGDLLRVETSQKPSWTTQPLLTAGSGKSGNGVEGEDEEVDELDPSSPLPPPEEDPPSVPSPASFSPPPTGRPNTRKRKTPPIRGITPHKSHKPISAHSPAKLNLTKSTTFNRTRSSGFFPAPKSPNVPLPRTAPRAKRQKTMESELPDSFADQRYGVKVKPHVFLDRMLSTGEGLELPKEMREDDGMSWSTQESHPNVNAMQEEKDVGSKSKIQGNEEDEVDEVENSVEGTDGIVQGQEGGASTIDQANRPSPAGVVEAGPNGVVVARTPSQPSVRARDFYHESINSSADAADTTTDSILFSPAKPDVIVEEPEHQPKGEDEAGQPIPSSPGRSFTPVSEPPPTEPSPISRPSHSSPPPSSPPHRASPTAEQSVFHKPRRGFTNVGVSQTQLSDSTPDRRDLFSSQGEAISSQSQTPASQRPWPAFQPTQVRQVESQESSKGQSTQESSGNGGAEVVEPTQIVSEESHERAQVQSAEKRRRQAEDMEVERHNQKSAAGSSGSDLPGDTHPQDGGKVRQQTSEIHEHPQNSIKRSSLAHSSPSQPQNVPMESIEPTYQTRRSDDQPTQTQANSEETLKRMDSYLAKQHQIQVEAKQRSPERGSEPPPIMPVIAEHRQLRRRNQQETRSAPGPMGLVIAAGVEVGVRPQTDPVPSQNTFRLPTPPRLPVSHDGQSDQPHDHLDERSASQDAQLPSSSASQTEDLLPLGVPTQATESQNRSASPPIRTAGNNRRSKRILHSASLSQSPEKRPKLASRQSSPITFSPSASHRTTEESSITRPSAPNQPGGPHTFEPTLLNNTIPTLPLVTKPPPPVKTYGTRKGLHASPARPPQADHPVLEIAAHRRLSKRVRGGEAMLEADGDLTNELDNDRNQVIGQRMSKVQAKRGKNMTPVLDRPEVVRAAEQPPSEQEETQESPDPLASAIDQPEDPAPGEEMDIDDPSQSASPPTQIDRNDYTYQPLINGKRGRQSGLKPVSKRTHVGPRSEEGVSEEDEDEDEVDGSVKKGEKVKGMIQSSKLASNHWNKRSSKPSHNVENGRSPVRGGKRGSKSTAPPLTDESLPEPESPPTPVDTTDETFQITSKGSKPRAGKKSISRQPSIASTSVSAGPSKPKNARTGGRKGRTSKLSVMTDDPPLPTPTSTSSGQEEDLSDRPLVFAYYKATQSFYPGRITARVGSDMYRVIYLDGDSAIVPLDEIRRCQLKEGDRIKCDLAEMRKRTDLEVAKDWAEVDGKIKLRGKKGESAGEYDIDDLRIARVTVQKLFDDRLADSDMFTDLPLFDADTSRSSTGISKSRSGTNTFSSKVFLITPTDDSTLHLRNTITRNDGLIYDDHSALFNKMEFGQFIRGDLGRVPFLITNAEIEAGKSGMKVKSMIALSFGIPILAPEYVEAALNEPGCDWRRYLISPGLSALHSFTTSQIVDPAWGMPNWDIMAAQHTLKPLAGKKVLFINLKPKMVEMKNIVSLCLTGLGASSLHITLTLADIDQSLYDILLVCNGDKDTKKLLPRGMMGNKKACDMQWLKQCMVSGACLPCKLDSYT